MLPDSQPADLPPYSIKLIPGARPIAAARVRHLTAEKRVFVDGEIDRLLSLGIIRSSNSPWAAPLVIAFNRASGKSRVCMDYKALNSQTVRDAYPIPGTADLLSSFSRQAVSRIFRYGTGL